MRRGGIVVKTACVAVVLAAAAGCGSFAEGFRDGLAEGESGTPSPSAPVTSGPAVPAAADTSPEISDGTYVVGVDIQPGVYRTAGSGYANGLPCYWARLSGTSGDLSEILANDNPHGLTTVTVKSSDRAFETHGCKPWQRIG